MDNLNIGGLTFAFNKSEFKTYEQGIRKEWVITNGLGGYAGSSIIDAPMRKHHGHLIASLWAPIKRYLILSKLNETLTIGDKSYPLHSTKYKNSITEGFKHLKYFYYDTFPIYTYEVGDIVVTKEIILKYKVNSVIIKYSISNGARPSKLKLSPCFNFKPHGDSSTKDTLVFQTLTDHQSFFLKPDDEDFLISYKISDGDIKDSTNLYDEDNYLDFEYETGMIGLDTHFTPICHEIELKANEIKEFYVQCEVIDDDNSIDKVNISNLDCQSSLDSYFEDVYYNHIKRMEELIKDSQVSSDLAKRLVLSSDQFIANRNSTKLKTVLAGLPWFSDWGRDTMIAIGGLTIATKQYETAKEILKSFSLYVKNGLLPNMFPDEGLDPLYNSVDASLWYFQAIYQYYTATEDKSLLRELYPTLLTIIKAFIQGTDFSIYMDKDKLIHAGSGLDQVTWMDVRINGVVVTPRHGKPVEINALWYNALQILKLFSSELNLDFSYDTLIEQVHASFNEKFWNPETNCLFDVVDSNDSSIRPNQIYAVSLPFTMLDHSKSKFIIDKVYKELYTPYGLRSLDQNHKDYKGIYKGPLEYRDFAYHQGTSWGFLLGGFISAYIKVYPNASKKQLIHQFLDPMKNHLYEGCLGGIAEIFDGDSPNHHRGCYTQAWSVSETLRALLELEA